MAIPCSRFRAWSASEAKIRHSARRVRPCIGRHAPGCSLIGFVFHNQWIVIDQPANTLGLSFSNGGTGKIGT